MSGNQSLPGYLCQEEAPVNVADGTLALTASPAPVTVTEEDVSYEIRSSYAPVPTTLVGLNPAELQVLAWLRAHQHLIADAEQRFRVDRRAIAGAIAWEMLENVIRDPKTKLSVGEGKVHTYYGNRRAPVKTAWSLIRLKLPIGDAGVDTSAKEVEEYGYLPPQSFENRVAILSTTQGAITYIAAIMAAIADLAAQHGFDDVRSNPVILANVYQGRTLRTWDAALKAKVPGSSFGGGNPMDIWVAAHIAFLEDGVGRPKLPESGSPALYMSVMPASSGPAPTASKTVTVAHNSSLSAIALAEYGSLDLWPLIYDLNKARIGPNPNLVSAGTTLSIAPLASYSAAQLAWARSQAPSWRHYR
ncbi:hypothetical protein LRS03_06145 [Rhizobacter sp. J219]|uniref:LysM peptidoglycan-binding domain-containing protein n=1 Tax=Rhizobacter sp. J219 TaxID=2898430 RepID=UPI0021519CA3|nr:hypothetical protein [Rhizobacter sp. J219]MCR5882465.1 hypothetical protein [Rhizobacter sp. J219]